MLPITGSQLGALIENLRLLEILVTGPLGLHSDIKMLRESMPVPGSEDLDRAALRERRTAIAAATDDLTAAALASIGSAGASLDSLSTLEGEDPPLPSEWIERARRVLSRAEEKVAGDARAETARRLSGVYVLIDPEVTGGRPVAEVAMAALRGGASAIQLRDKRSDARSILGSAEELREACEAQGSLFIVNDFPDIAVLSGAAGVHLGQDDLPTAAARRLASPRQLIGRSTNTLNEALSAQAEGADYIAVGPVFATDTMGKGSKSAVGTEAVRAVRDRVRPAVVAIGGIGPANIGETLAAGADAVCVASAVTLADDPEAACRALVDSAAAG